MPCCSPKKPEDEHEHSHRSSLAAPTPIRKNSHLRTNPPHAVPIPIRKNNSNEESNNISFAVSATETKTKSQKNYPTDELLEEILGIFPYKAQTFAQQEIANAGLHCVGCHAAGIVETLEAGMMTHGRNRSPDR